MIVYVKSQSGEIYASPVFAQISSFNENKIVVLNQFGDGLMLFPYLRKKSQEFRDRNNYYYIDEKVEDKFINGKLEYSKWIKGKKVSGFEEIIKNRSLFRQLKRGKTVSTDGLDIVKKYSLPLPVIYDFEIKNEQDVDTLSTVSCYLHDADIKKIDKIDDTLIIYFEPLFGPNIIINFHNVKEAIGIDKMKCILDFACTIDNNQVTFDFDDAYEEEQLKIVAERVTWKIIINK